MIDLTRMVVDSPAHKNSSNVLNVCSSSHWIFSKTCLPSSKSPFGVALEEAALVVVAGWLSVSETEGVVVDSNGGIYSDGRGFAAIRLDRRGDIVKLWGR